VGGKSDCSKVHNINGDTNSRPDGDGLVDKFREAANTLTFETAL
jgi:hypothetical protein